jgi:hypothetical protein
VRSFGRKNMKYSEKVKFIKESLNGEILLTQAGKFYIAVGSDAVFLHNLLGLKCTCFCKDMCKVGFPVDSLEKHCEKLIASGYSFIVCDVDSDGEFVPKKVKITNKKYNEPRYNIGCETCPKNKYAKQKKNEEEKEKLNSFVSLLNKYKEKTKNE